MTASIDDLIACTDPALIVVTTASRGQRAGCLVGFHSQCSIVPLRYAVWLSKPNHTYSVALSASHFAVHLLGADQHELAELFGAESGDSVDKFAEHSSRVGDGDVPLLDGCAAIVFEKEGTWDEGGDHVCLVGAPVAVVAAERFTPLRLAAAADLDPGHAPDERPATDDTREASPDEVEELQEIAAGFGHELTAEQVEAFNAEHESAGDDPDPGRA